MNSILENFKSPEDIQLEIAQRARRARLDQNISQKELAEKSGVSLGSLRRFEQKGEISLGSLVLIAIALNRAGDFKELFESKSLPDLFAPSPKERERARES